MATSKQAPKTARVTLGQAKAHNFGLVANPSALAAAGVVRTSKGENPKRRLVYGYDNGQAGGRINKAAVLHLVPGFTGTPKGVTDKQWAALSGFSGKTVQAAYDGGVDSRTVRRSYRAGAIRFAQ